MALSYTQRASRLIGVVLLAVAGLSLVATAEDPGSAPANGQAPVSVCEPATLGSPYITVDSWVYPAIFRLYSLGFLDHVFLGMRPWTLSLIHISEPTRRTPISYA